jgi:glycosyltransferase involved in cell wall biosynthesis
MTTLQLNDFPQPPEGRTGWPWTEMPRDPSPTLNEKFKWPGISIITPSYNQGQYIEETIRSLLLQNYPNLECIVIDGGSSDTTLQILNKYDRFIKWVSEPDEGQTDAINKGLKMASGEIIAYLNSDDLYEPGTFRTIAQAFVECDDIAMIYGNIIHIDEYSRFIEYHETGDLDLARYMSGAFYLPQPSVFFRKCVLRTLGLFDKELHLAMDFDYWLRIILTFKTMYIPQPLAKARIYPQAKSIALDYRYIEERIYILDKIFRQYKLETLRKKVYGYTYFIGALTFMKKYFFRDAIRYFRLALKTDYYYLFHPYLYWWMLEMIIGGKNGKKIKPLLKKIIKSNPTFKFT